MTVEMAGEYEGGFRLKRLTTLGIIILLVLTCLGSAGAKVTLKVAHFYDPMGGSTLAVNYEWFQNLIAEFEKENPDIKVEQEIFQWDQIDVKAMADYRAGIKAHDVFLTSPQLMAQHKLVGCLADLTGFVENDWSAEDIQDFSWSSVWDSVELDGELLALPLGAHTRALAYNRRMFEEVGLNPDVPPTTLEEQVEMGQKLTRDLNGDGKTDVWGLGMYFGPSRATIEMSFGPLVWHYGSKMWDPETKKAIFANEAGVKAVQYCMDLMHKYEITPKWAVSGTYDDVTFANFMQENYAMTWGWGSYWIAPFEEKGWTEGLFPPTANGKTKTVDVGLTPTEPKAAFTNAWCVSMYKLSQNQDAAWKFINFMLKPEYLANYPDAGLPGRASLWDTPEMQTPFYKVWKDAVALGRPMPPTAHYAELADTVATSLQNILVNKADIQSTLKQAEDDYNAQYAGE